MKSSTPASAAMAAAVIGLSPVIMTVRMPILRSWAKRSLMPPLTTSLSSTTPSTLRAIGHDQRRAAGAGGGFDGLARHPPDRRRPVASTHGLAPNRPRLCGCCGPSRSTPLMRVCAVKGTKVACGCSNFAAADVELLLGEHHDAAAFGRFIGQRGELRGIGELLLGDAGRGHEIRGHAIADGDGAGFVEQQHVDVARRLDGAAAGGHDVAADQAVDAADADGAEQAADGRGNQADQQRDQHRRW